MLLVAPSAEAVAATPSMSEESNSLAGDPAQVIGQRRRSKLDRSFRRSRRASSRRGRRMLIVIFCVLGGMNVLVYFGVPRESHTPALLAAIVTSLLWYAALLAGIWRRKNWCRYALILVQFLAVAAFTIVVPSSLQVLDDPRALGIFVADIAICSATAWALARSPDIKRLTRPSHE